MLLYGSLSSTGVACNTEINMALRFDNTTGQLRSDDYLVCVHSDLFQIGKSLKESYDQSENTPKSTPRVLYSSLRRVLERGKHGIR